MDHTANHSRFTGRCLVIEAFVFSSINESSSNASNGVWISGVDWDLDFAFVHMTSCLCCCIADPGVTTSAGFGVHKIGVGSSISRRGFILEERDDIGLDLHDEKR